jgi:hypothetical protein
MGIRNMRPSSLFEAARVPWEFSIVKKFLEKFWTLSHLREKRF